MTGSALSAQTTKLIDVTDPRPLWGALDALEIMVGAPINYEDPPFENEADLQDVSTPQQRAAQPGYHLLVPRSGQVMAQVQQAAAGIASEGDVTFDVNLLLSSYRQNALPGDFKVEQANGTVYVTPTKILGANGAVRAVTSPLMTPISVPYAKRTVEETAQAIFDAVYSATGQKIVIGTFPFWPTDTVSFGVNTEPARDALASLFALAGRGPLSYRLTFDPRPDSMRIFDYMINVQPAGFVSPAAPSGLGPILGIPTVNSQQPANTPPGFTKAGP